MGLFDKLFKNKSDNDDSLKIEEVSVKKEKIITDSPQRMDAGTRTEKLDAFQRMKDEALERFRQHNTTTDDIYEPGKTGTLIILHDGTNITSWSDCPSREEIEFISEDLSNVEFEGLKQPRARYKNCSNVKAIIVKGIHDAVDFKNMFEGCTNLITVKGMESWDLSGKRIDFSSMFKDCGFYDLMDFENLDVSDVRWYENMFFHCENLEFLDGLESWKVRCCATSAMFARCENIVDATALESWSWGGWLVGDIETGLGVNFTFGGSEKRIDYYPNQWDALK